MLELKLNHVNKRGPRCVNVIEELAVHVTVLQRKLGIKEALKVAIAVPIKKLISTPQKGRKKKKRSQATLTQKISIDWTSADIIVTG